VVFELQFSASVWAKSYGFPCTVLLL